MNPNEIQQLAKLARIAVSQETLEQSARSITEVLSLVDQLQSADTQGVEPLAHPLEAEQVLRPDDITETDRRDDFIALAPDSEDGLFLVPRVIE